MSTRANITSIEALEAFRTALILYVNKARPTLDEVSHQVLRTRLWLQSDQRSLLENHVRRRAKTLEEAQQELFSANLANLRQATAAEQMAVRKAKRALEEAEEKLQVLKRWNRDFESRVTPLAKQLEKVDTVLTRDLPQAIAYLAQVVKTLDAYAGVMPELTGEAPNLEGNAPSLPKGSAQESGSGEAKAEGTNR